MGVALLRGELLKSLALKSPGCRWRNESLILEWKQEGWQQLFWRIFQSGWRYLFTVLCRHSVFARNTRFKGSTRFKSQRSLFRFAFPVLRLGWTPHCIRERDRTKKPHIHFFLHPVSDIFRPQPHQLYNTLWYCPLAFERSDCEWKRGVSETEKEIRTGALFKCNISLRLETSSNGVEFWRKTTKKCMCSSRSWDKTGAGYGWKSTQMVPKTMKETVPYRVTLSFF